MYTSKFVASDGSTYYFGYEWGILFDIDPLSELDVEVTTSQGFLQTGTSIESETVEGVSREIKGVFVDYSQTSLVQDMLDIFTPGTHGQLYFNEDRYCDCVVEKTPTITLKNRVRSFSLLLYCWYPYWLYTDSTSYGIGGYTAAFEFPVCYDEHTFGTRNDELFTDCYNSGSVERPITVRFKASTTVTNYGIELVATDDYLQINDTLESGEVTDVYWDNNHLYVEKTVNGVTTNIFSLMDEGSTLFTLEPGSNVIQAYAESGFDALTVVVSVAPAVSGVFAVD